MNLIKENADSAGRTRQCVAVFGFGGTLIGLLASHTLQSPSMVIAGAAAGAVVGLVFAGNWRNNTR